MLYRFICAGPVALCGKVLKQMSCFGVANLCRNLELEATSLIISVQHMTLHTVVLVDYAWVTEKNKPAGDISDMWAVIAAKISNISYTYGTPEGTW